MTVWVYFLRKENLYSKTNLPLDYQGGGRGRGRGEARAIKFWLNERLTN